MRMTALLACLALNTATFVDACAQSLKPGFDREEYIELLKLFFHYDATSINETYAPQRFSLNYTSPVAGLDNRWYLWTTKDSVAAICLRGTTQNTISWVANFYAAMVPANGTLQLNSDTTPFAYHLASNPRATVHIGWLIGMAELSKTILPKIDSCYRQGIRQYIITGHSQGGGIAFLLTSYLYNLQATGRLPRDIRFKTYCSAGPKPGNLYYAYDYELTTQGGWAFNVVNPADWVPEVPVSIQTLNDFVNTNPFVNVSSIIRKQKFPRNLVFRHVYNRLSKPPKRAQRKYQKFLGKYVGKMVKQHLKGYQPPAYAPTSDYVRTGVSIILPADSAYYRLFPNNPQKVFTHHLFAPYYYLAKKLPAAP